MILIRSNHCIICALVQSILEYCSIVWLPYHETWINLIESVQKQFTMFALKEYPTVSNHYHISSYESRIERLEMVKLERRRTNAALLFFYRLINNQIHCPLLGGEIVIQSNQFNFRDSTLRKFKIKNQSLHQPESPINQICRFANIVGDLFNIASSCNNFKTLIKSSDLLNIRLKTHNDRYPR